jgi:hypothetical protein
VTGGLIASALEQELHTELRRRGIVVWLDATGYFRPVVNALLARTGSSKFPFPAVAFQGSFLELILALEPYGNGLDNEPLLVYMPGFTEATIRKTPMLELYEPGFRFRKAPETLIREVARGRVVPDAIEKFLANGAPRIEDAEAWLEGQLADGHEGRAKVLEQLGIATVLDETLKVVQDQPGYLASNFSDDASLEVLRAFFEHHTGMDGLWLGFFGQAGGAKLKETANALIGWLLSVEYVQDLLRPPLLPELTRLRDLVPPLVKTCQRLVQRLRDQHPDAYANLADEAELHLHRELAEMRAEDLGRLDTFRIEETRVLEAAVDALKAGEWQKARDWAAFRTEESSFWLQRDPARRRCWSLIREAAELGATLAGQPRPLERATTIQEAVESYTAKAFEVDRAQRRFEQKQTSLLDSQLPHFGELKEAIRLLRASYRDWADRLAADFTAICRENGFLPEPVLQQRTIFEQVVAPLAAEERVAYFLLDAFRFEMATELLDDFGGAGTVVDLKARLAELPTITPVGMNALAPVSLEGRLQVAGSFAGFKAGEFTVRTPEDRARAIRMRGGGKQSAVLSLSEVCDLEPEQLKRKLKDVRIVVVHGTEIDDAGEANVGPATFEISLRQLRSAYAQLQKAGVKSFVFSADHGFLLIDDSAQRAIPFGTRRDAKRRFVLDDHPRAEAEMVNVSLAALGYDGLSGYLLFREDTAVFATSNYGATFVHGGNSLQERVIPVLTVRRNRAEGKTHVGYTVDAEALEDIMGVRRLKVRIQVARGDSGQLVFVAAKEVAVGIRAAGQPEVVAILKDLSGPGLIRDGALRLPVSNDWSELCFTLETLEGTSTKPVRIELYHPEGVERVEPRRLEEWFEVDCRRDKRGSAAEPAAEEKRDEERDLEWADSIVDPGARAVFLHLERHGSITEAEVTRMVGSPRAFRRFSLDFDGYARKVPFRVRIDAAEDGKRYVKEGEK